MPMSATTVAREPSYGFPAKAKYRRDVWEFADSGLSYVPVRDREILYLDSGQLLETEYLLEQGYSPGNMICGSNSPATNANITRKFDNDKRMKNIRRWGGDVFDGIGCHGVLHTVNADLCQQITSELLGRIERVGKSDNRPGIFAVTVSCFHEQWKTLPEADEKLLQWAGRFNDGRAVTEIPDRRRVSALLAAMTGNRDAPRLHTVCRVKFGTYKSPVRKNGGLKMLWAGVEYANF